MGAYGAAATGMAAFVAVRGRRLPDRLTWSDLALLAVATHKLSRQLAKDPVTSPLRAPFTRYAGTSAEAELDEEVRGAGMRKGLGELVSCPFCLGQWAATLGVFGLIVAPRGRQRFRCANRLRHAAIRLCQAPARLRPASGLPVSAGPFLDRRTTAPARRYRPGSAEIAGPVKPACAACRYQVARIWGELSLIRVRSHLPQVSACSRQVSDTESSSASRMACAACTRITQAISACCAVR